MIEIRKSGVQLHAAFIIHLISQAGKCPAVEFLHRGEAHSLIKPNRLGHIVSQQMYLPHMAEPLHHSRDQPPSDPAALIFRAHEDILDEHHAGSVPNRADQPYKLPGVIGAENAQGMGKCRLQHLRLVIVGASPYAFIQRQQFLTVTNVFTNGVFFHNFLQDLNFSDLGSAQPHTTPPGGSFHFITVSGKYSRTKSTFSTWKLLPFRYSRLPASVVN